MKHRSTKHVNHKDSIALDFGDTRDGTTQAGQVCPACSGGPTQEGSLSVTRRGGLLLYNCHRASCTFHGAVNLGGRQREGVWSQEQKADRPRIQTEPIDEATAAFLAKEYRLTSSDLQDAGVKRTRDSDRYVPGRVCYPIYGPDAKERGASYRSYVKGQHPKSIIQLNDESAVACSWYKWQRKSDTLVLVEDQVSAIRLAPYVHSLALLGTHISESKLEEIKAGGYERVLITLDADATHEAIKLQLRLRNEVKGILVAALYMDVKNMSRKELGSWLERNKLGTYALSDGQIG